MLDAPLKQPEPVVLKIDKNGRAGRTVTLVDGLRMHPEGKTELLSKFKKRCGAGGTIKDGKLEIQGDQRNILKAELEANGYKVKLI